MDILKNGEKKLLKTIEKICSKRRLFIALAIYLFIVGIVAIVVGFIKDDLPYLLIGLFVIYVTITTSFDIGQRIKLFNIIKRLSNELEKHN